MTTPKQSFFYGDDPVWLRRQKQAYTKVGLQWPPMRRKKRYPEAKE